MGDLTSNRGDDSMGVPKGAPAPAPETDGSGRRALVRSGLAVVAMVLIAFCAWSAHEYARGGDPFALFGGSAFRTVAEPETSDDAETPATTGQLSAAVEDLAFDGESVSATGCALVVSDGDIWVEQRTGDEAPRMVLLTARRAAALASWADARGYDTGSVNWICEDRLGTVRMVVRFSCDDAPTSGDSKALLSAAEAYAISADAYASLGANPGYGRTSGDVPTLPDGTPVPVSSKRSEVGEQLESSATGTSVGSVIGGSSSSSAASGGGSSSDSPSSSDDGTVTVGVTVDGSAAGAGSSSATVSLAAGSTAYDALAATGVSLNARMTQFGMYVSSIAGLAEKEHGGMSGWVYAVNGSEPNTACSNYVMRDGDTLVWTYVNVTE